MNIYGLVGEKLGHSFSKKIHEIIFENTELTGTYNYFEIEKKNIKNLPVAIKTLSIKGVNITIPYKESLMKSLDQISKNALEIGAINCIYNDGGRLLGENTDYFGIKKTFEKMKFNPEEKKAIILGSGGASKAVALCLKNSGAKEVLLVTRDENDGNLNYLDLLNISKKDIIINTTPVGTSPEINSTLVEKSVFKNFDYAFDLIYNPLETRFLKDGKSVGLTCENGLYMLVAQAIKSQEIWNNTKLEKEEYNEVYEKVLEFYN